MADEMIVPDYCEALIGWRSWAVDPRNHLLYSREGWPPFEPLVAKHLDVVYSPSPPSEESRCLGSPCSLKTRSGRGCGVYAYKHPTPLQLGAMRRWIVYSMGCKVIGRVALWGRITEHEDGYRAQFAYPIEFVCAVECDGNKVAANYGVPFVEDPEWISETQSDELSLNLSLVQSLLGYMSVNPPRALTIGATNPIQAPLHYTQIPVSPSPNPSPRLHQPESLSLIKKPRGLYKQPSFHLHRPTRWWKDGRLGLWMRTERPKTEDR